MAEVVVGVVDAVEVEVEVEAVVVEEEEVGEGEEVSLFGPVSSYLRFFYFFTAIIEKPSTINTVCTSMKPLAFFL